MKISVSIWFQEELYHKDNRFVLWSEAHQIFIKTLNFRKTSSSGSGENLVWLFSDTAV